MHHLFEHRKGFCLSVFYFAIIFSLNLIPQGIKPYLLFSASLLAVFVFLSPKRQALRHLTVVLLVFALATLPSLLYDLSDDLTENAVGEKREVVLTVYDVSYSGDNICFASGVLNTLDGENTHVRIRITSSESGLRAGDVLSGVGFITAIERGDENGVYQLSRGYRYELTLYDAKHIDTASTPSILAAKARARLASVTDSYIPGERGALLSALLLGERDGLSDALTADMNRLGISHMLALSGMHFSVLLLGLERLLLYFSLDKRYRYALLSVLTLLYLCLTGFPVSAVRAGIMLLFVFVAFFSRKDYDAITSLGFSVALICTLQPYAALDGSLWLSAFATFGILLVLERGERNLIHTEKPGLFKLLCRAVSTSVKFTLAASLATLPLTAYMFGKLPLLFVVANLLFAPLMNFLLLGAIFLLLFGWIPAVSSAISFVAGAVIDLSSLLSAIPGTQLALNHPLVASVFMLCVLFIFLYVGFCPKKRFLKRTPLLIILCTSLILGGFYGVRFLANIGTLTVEYAATDKKNADYFILKGNGKTTVIDNTLAAKTHFEDVNDTLLSLYECEIDTYVFTVYQSSLKSGAEELFGSYTVHRVYLPAPQSDDEEAIFAELKRVAKENRVRLFTYDVSAPLSLSGATFTLHHRSEVGDEAKRTYYSISYGEHTLAYISSGMLTTYNAMRIHRELVNADVVVFGSYGSKNTASFNKVLGFTNARVYAAKATAIPFARIDGARIADSHSFKLRK